MTNYILNPELNGIELYFDKKPLQNIIDALKSNGFRWSGFKKCWYAKQTEQRIKLAEELTGITEESTINTITATTEQTKIESKTTNKIENDFYFPNYTTIDNSKILENSDIDLNLDSSYYFYDINAYIHFFTDSVIIIDLKNALKTGKKCKRYCIQFEVWQGHDRVLLFNKLRNANINTFKDLYNIIENFNIEGLKIQTSEEKSINTFSPFTVIKPIKTPSKWTLSHVWKAILSGQIYKGTKDGHYTDDYAYDAAENFGKGSNLNLFSFAKSLIEHSSGWRVSVDNSENNKIQLSVNCHSFDYNTLYYDKNCNLNEADNRQNNEENTRKEYNNNMESKVKEIKVNEVKENKLYTVTYLEMDRNTGMYGTITELLKGSELFFKDEVYYTDSQQEEPTIIIENRYKVTEIQEYIIKDDKLFTISDFYNRPYFEDDNRYINMGNWKYIITGKALKEVLTEGKSFPCIKESREYQTFESAITEIQKFISGKMSWCFGSCDTDYKETYNRLMKEINRI